MSTFNPKDFVVGSKLKLTLRSKALIEGIVFAIDEEGHRLILEESIQGADTDLRNTRILNISAIQFSTLIEESTSSKIEPLPALTKEQVQRREKAAFRQHEEALLRAGPPGTSPLAQELYDVLSKTFECKWKGGNIEVTQLGVTIKPPFRAIDVSGKDPRSVQYVKDLLQRIQHK